VKTALVVLQKKRIKRNSFAYIIGQAINYSLLELGIQSRIVSDKEHADADCAFVVWSCSIDINNYRCKKYIHITSEQLPYYQDAPTETQERWKEIEPHFKKYDCIFEYSSCQVEFLKQRGINVVNFQWGYTPLLDWYRHNKDKVKVTKRPLFIGGLTPRRRQLNKELKRQGIDLLWHHNKDYRGQEGELIASHMVNLNIHKDPRDTLETGRIVCLSLANRAFVITEPYEDTVPLVDGQHFVVAETKDLADKIKYYLEHDKDREEIAEQGYRFVRKHYTMTQNLERAMAQL